MEAIKRIEQIRKDGLEAKGRKELIACLEGERLTTRQMCLAKCYDCMGWYTDGKQDCEGALCPLYPIMPYRKQGEKYSGRKGKPMSEEHKAKLRQGRVSKITTDGL